MLFWILEKKCGSSCVWNFITKRNFCFCWDTLQRSLWSNTQRAGSAHKIAYWLVVACLSWDVYAYIYVDTQQDPFRTSCQGCRNVDQVQTRHTGAVDKNLKNWRCWRRRQTGELKWCDKLVEVQVKTEQLVTGWMKLVPWRLPGLVQLKPKLGGSFIGKLSLGRMNSHRAECSWWLSLVCLGDNFWCCWWSLMQGSQTDWWQPCCVGFYIAWPSWLRFSSIPGISTRVLLTWRSRCLYTGIFAGRTWQLGVGCSRLCWCLFYSEGSTLCYSIPSGVWQGWCTPAQESSEDSSVSYAARGLTSCWLWWWFYQCASARTYRWKMIDQDRDIHQQKKVGCLPDGSGHQ